MNLVAGLWTSSNKIYVLPILNTLELGTAFQMGSHQCKVEGQNHLLQPADHTAFDAAQDVLPAHVQPLIHHHSQVLLGRAALNLFIPWPVLIPGIALIHMQHLALSLVKPHEILMHPLPQLVQIPLNGILSFRCVNSTAQLDVICRFSRGALYPFIYVLNEDVKHWF
ncbi:hypothetical protein WISP_11805 [Willisornis vidua]|uniref:Uncharacterized protein n=1 Tax=Willisornis vidua TaxID=1566151 RepID=A0ABQ9DVG8_9PASS|nr:hypothetical protein WISP_11805 [Willisornis vidua]